MAGARTPRKLEGEALWDFALRALGNRPYSAAELRRKLVGKAVSPPEVVSVMAKLREYGLTDDNKFSELFASSRLANQGFGRFRVLQELRKRQVSSSVAEKAVADVFAGTDERHLAETFLTRKYRGKDLKLFLSEDKNFAAAYRRLRMAGFSSGITLSVLKLYNQRADEFVETEEPE